jgi:hypothetical protein
VAELYFEDGSVAQACPPLQALLHVMRDGNWQGRGLADAEFRRLFTREYLLGSDWYAERLQARQTADVILWRNHASYCERFLKRASHADEAERLGIAERLKLARATLATTQAAEYVASLRGTLGAEPIGNYTQR